MSCSVYSKVLAPSAALTWTISLLATIPTVDGSLIGNTIFLVYLLASIPFLHSLHLIRMTAWLLLPLAIPLFFVHGILNPSYSSNSTIGGFVPIRIQGLRYAAITSVHLGMVAMAFVIWKYVDRRHALVFFQRIHLPDKCLILLMVATSSMELLSERSRAVFLAQQARGVKWSGSLLSRFASFPRLLIPVVTASIVEGLQRGTIMEHRGLGSVKMRVPDRWADGYSSLTVVTATLTIAPAILGWLIYLLT